MNVFNERVLLNAFMHNTGGVWPVLKGIWYLKVITGDYR